VRPANRSRQVCVKPSRGSRWSTRSSSVRAPETSRTSMARRMASISLRRAKGARCLRARASQVVRVGRRIIRLAVRAASKRRVASPCGVHPLEGSTTRGQRTPTRGRCRDGRASERGSRRRQQSGAAPRSTCPALSRWSIVATPTVTRPASAAAAVAAAARGVLVVRVPGQAAYVDGEYAAYLATVPDGPAKANGISAGEQVAAAILAWRADDGFDNNVPWEQPRPGRASSSLCFRPPRST
jgi:hypothetical protein